MTHDLCTMPSNSLIGSIFLQTCLIWSHTEDRDVALLKNEKLSMVLKFKRNEFLELRGKLSPHNSYSEGKTNGVQLLTMTYWSLLSRR